MSEGKPPLVLVHGWASHPQVWAPIAAALEERFSLVPVALPGYAADSAELPEQVEAVGEWLRSRTPEGATWLAWSMGALPALYLAMGTQAHVARLNLVAPVIRFEQCDDWSCGAPHGILRGFRIALRRDADALLERFTNMVLESDVEPSRTESMPHPLRATGIDSRVLEAGLTLLGDADLRHQLGDIARPVTLFHGERDAVVSADSSRFAHAALPDARLSLLQGAGHAPFVTHAQLFMQKFLGDGRF